MCGAEDKAEAAVRTHGTGSTAQYGMKEVLLEGTAEGSLLGDSGDLDGPGYSWTG